MGHSGRLGETIICTAASTLVGRQQVTSDIDMIDSDGHVWMRLTTWENKRFFLPEGFYRHLLDLDQTEMATSWPEPLAGFPQPQRFQCRRASGAFPADRSFWKRVWAYCILSTC